MGLKPALAVLAVCAFGQIASAQMKVAVVNLQEAVFESGEIKKADADMQAKYKPRLQEIEKLANEGSSLQQKLQSGQGKLTPQAEADLNAQIARLQRDVQRKNEDLQADTERDKNEVLSRASEKMEEVVKKLAEERGFDLIVDSSTTLYFKPAMEITKDVIAAYDKAYPAGAPAAGAAAPATPAAAAPKAPAPKK
jgi:outer membrane protein